MTFVPECLCTSGVVFVHREAILQLQVQDGMVVHKWFVECVIFMCEKKSKKNKRHVRNSRRLQQLSCVPETVLNSADT